MAEKSDSSNLYDGIEADLGIEEGAVNDDEDDGSGGEENSQGSQTRSRRHFTQQPLRPLVRTPARSGGRTTGAVLDVTQLMMANLTARMERDDAEREERCEAAAQQQQMNMMMMMAIVSAINPVAASLMQGIQNQMMQQFQ
jgi:hypothetical protein